MSKIAFCFPGQGSLEVGMWREIAEAVPEAMAVYERGSLASGMDLRKICFESPLEDLVDTGLSLGYLLGHLRARGPRTLDVCALLDRPARRILPLDVRYVGLEIPDVYVLGYGLHHQDRYRNLPQVVVADRDVVLADPDAYVPLLYGRRPTRHP